MDNYMYLVPVAAVVALLFAAYLANKVSKMDAGTDRMKEIADAIAEGARAFLGAEYKILVIFVAVLFVLIGVGIQNWIEAICFVVGALFSTIAGYCGMTVATKANVRTANAAKEHGMNKALSIAFSGGAVMGMCVAGLGALGVSLVYIFTKNTDVLFGFSKGNFLFVYHVQQFGNKVCQADETLDLIAAFTKVFGHDLVGTFLCPNLGHIFF